MIKVKEIKPLFNQIVTTRNVYTAEDAMQGGLYTTKEDKIMEYQKVLAVGPAVKEIKVGDMIYINPGRYMHLIHKQGLQDLERNITKDDMHAVAVFPTELIFHKDEDGNEWSEQVLVLYDTDVHYIVSDYEEFKPNPAVLVDKPSIIIQPHPFKKRK